MEYLLHIFISIGIYIILSLSLNLILGYCGLLSIAHAAFYGVGAYVAALLATQSDSPFLVNMACAIICAGTLGAIVGLPSLRIHGDYFAIATFAFQMITFSVMNNWISITGGPIGISGIPKPRIFGWELATSYHFLILLLILCSICIFMSHRMVASPFGRVLKAIREDEIFAESLGKNVNYYKVIVFVFGASMASVSGVVYAYYIRFIDPTSFTMMESIFIISIVVIGGSGSILGSVIGAVVLVILPEALRFLDLPTSVSSNLRQVCYGGLLLFFMLFRPQGLRGVYNFRANLCSIF